MLVHMQTFLKVPFPTFEGPEFTPQWFAITMGTGILALLLAQLPFAAAHFMAPILWVLNFGLFLTFCVMGALKYRSRAARLDLLHHPTQPFFLGTLPMGLCTLINGLLHFIGPSSLPWAIGLWILDVLLSVGCLMLLPVLRKGRTLTPLWLLPLVPCGVAAVGATQFMNLLPETHTGILLYSGYVLWGLSVPAALVMIGQLIRQFQKKGLPPHQEVFGLFLPIGPLATGALGWFNLGQHASGILYDTALPVATLLWGAASVWVCFALMRLQRAFQQPLAFHLGWWGLTFPVGAFALTTLTLAGHTHLPVLQQVGALMVVLIGMLWMLVGGKTLKLWQVLP